MSAAPQPAETGGFPWGLVAVAVVLAAGLLAAGLYVRRRLSGDDASGESGDEA